MAELIILGIIPGTTFEITFAMWMTVILGICGKYAFRSARRRRLFEIFVIASAIKIHTHRVRA